MINCSIMINIISININLRAWNGVVPIKCRKRRGRNAAFNRRTEMKTTRDEGRSEFSLLLLKKRVGLWLWFRESGECFERERRIRRSVRWRRWEEERTKEWGGSNGEVMSGFYASQHLCSVRVTYTNMGSRRRRMRFNTFTNN